MPEKQSSIFRNSENIDVIHKRLKVVDKPQGKHYAPGINIQGKYLCKYGFQVGDLVKIAITENLILIEKVLKEIDSKNS